MRALKITVAALALSIPAVAMSAEPGFFAGFAVGQSFLEFTQGSDAVDDQDTGFQLQASYNFSERWGVQAAYQSIGDFDDDDLRINVDGFELNGMISHGLTQRISVHGRAGVMLLDSESERVVNGQVVASTDDSEARAVFTLGSNLKADENLSFNVEGKYVLDSDIDLYLIQAGLQGQFGGANNK